MHIKRTLWIVVFAILLTAGVNAARDEPKEKLVTGKAPDFTANDIAGNEVSLSQFKDKIVVLEWTNYDCPFVKAHYTEKVHTMKDLSKKYADKDVVWLTINSTNYATSESIKEWAEALNIQNQTVLVDTDGTVGKKYHAKTTPHMFIIDTNGNIVYQGAIDNAPAGSKPDSYVNYIDQALMQLLAGEEITIPQTKPYGCSVKYPPKSEADK